MSILALLFLSLAMIKRDVSLAKSFALDFNSLVKSLIWIRTRRGPRIKNVPMNQINEPK